eukprot:TRINITY_DN13614_c0_g1_i1.p1 TRINITY_DN13614_c0_g1~~TRINITY_DN13614_c0_g1_i1.p1  ORF type:complete len:299 (-),score=120.24 TRINITY_DN13614_c0_g1_i1:248-1144(-)
MASKGSAFETLAPISAACAVTAAAMYPVDVVRALKMASATGHGYTASEFIAKHGVRGMLTQGVAPEVARATWMRVLKFFFFPITFQFMWGKPVAQGNSAQNGLAGMVAVAPEVATITTLELAKIGLQLDSEKRFANSGVRLAKHVYGERGFVGVMAGWQGVQARQMLWTGAYFATLDSYKALVASADTSDALPVSVRNFAGGFLAGVTGAAANTPADVIRTNIQKEALSGKSKDSGVRLAFSFGKMLSLGSEIVAARGAAGLYSGFGFKALHMGGSGAFVAMLIPVFSSLMGINRELM